MNQHSKQNQKSLHPTATRQRKQLVKNRLLRSILNLATKADHLRSDKARTQLVQAIHDLTIEYQAKD